MSRTISIDSLTSLRKQFHGANEDNLSKQFFLNNSFNFNEVQLVHAPEYPDLTKDTVDMFYNKYSSNPKNEFELAKIIYENIQVSRNLAANNLYWVYLNLKYFFPYIKNRWLKIKNDEQDNFIDSEIDRYFLTLEPSQSSLMKSPVAGLWWSMELTIDKRLDDPYYYSKLFFSDTNLRTKNIGTYQFIRHKNILQALLDFYQNHKDEKIDQVRIGSEAIAQQSSKTLNQIGGLTLLSFLSKLEIYQLLENQKHLILDRALQVKKAKVTSKEKIKAENQIPVIDEMENSFDHYFVLNGQTGEYMITQKPIEGWEYNIGLKIDNPNCYIIHVYKEGKIKKTNLDDLKSKINRGKLNWHRPFLNGKNASLTLKTVLSVNTEVLFAIAYNDGNDTYVKIFDAQDNDLFRNDISNLLQEGKKVIYSERITDLWFKTIPVEYGNNLRRLFKNPLSKGVLLNNPTYSAEWVTLGKIWPELFIENKKRQIEK